MIRPSLVFALIATLAAAAPFAQNAAAPKASAEANKPGTGKAGFRELNWDDLLPKDWDPYKDLKDMKLALPTVSPNCSSGCAKSGTTHPSTISWPIRLCGFRATWFRWKNRRLGLNEFLLVPYFGACIHTPPPPSNQIVHVLPRQTVKGFHLMDTVRTTKTVRSDNAMGASKPPVEAVSVEPYVEKPKNSFSARQGAHAPSNA